MNMQTKNEQIEAWRDDPHDGWAHDPVKIVQALETEDPPAAIANGDDPNDDDPHDEWDATLIAIQASITGEDESQIS